MQHLSRVVVEIVIGVGGMFIGLVLGLQAATSGFAMDLTATGEFVTKFFDAVAWSVGILVIVLIFREQIRSKIGDITSDDFQGTRFEFVRRVSLRTSMKRTGWPKSLGTNPIKSRGKKTTKHNYLLRPNRP